MFSLSHAKRKRRGRKMARSKCKRPMTKTRFGSINPMNTRSNKELLNGHAITHKIWRDLKKGKTFGNWTKSATRNEHSRLVCIMKKRDFDHNSPLR